MKKRLDLSNSIFALFIFYCVYVFRDRYTLWNAEYRVSLIRNLDIPVQRGDKRTQRESFDLKDRQTERESGIEELETIRPQVFGDLSPEALNSIQRLQSELSCVKEVSNFNAFSYVYSQLFFPFYWLELEWMVGNVEKWRRFFNFLIGILLSRLCSFVFI